MVKQNNPELIHMDYRENVASSDEFNRFSSYLAKFSFFMYLFFLFFGISMPFQERATTTADFSTSNPVNQFVISVLYLISFVSLIPKRGLVVKFIKTEKLFSLFLLWALFSVFWSEYPFVSFKRYVRFFGMAIIFLSVLLQMRSTDESLTYIKTILIIYIPLTFLSILLIPGATDLKSSAWRGLALTKNGLGQVSLISLIVWSQVGSSANLKKRMVHFLFWMLSCILLIGSKSITALLTGVILVSFAGLFFADKKFLRPVIGKFGSILFLSLLIVGVAAGTYFAREYIPVLLDTFGKDSTLTGRLDLWDMVFQEARKHLITGSGYGGFWVTETTMAGSFYEGFEWLPRSAHSGYLDVMNETGVIGLLILVFMIISYFVNLAKFGKSHYWKFFIIAALILNITESSLVRPRNLSGDLFIFAYLVLFVEIVKKRYNYSDTI
jgi:O-antigen ligase